MFVEDTATSMQILQTMYGEKIGSLNMAHTYYTLFAVHPHFVISSLFANTVQRALEL